MREHDYMDEYTVRHDAMQLLWGVYHKAKELPLLRRRIVSAIQYLRETAMAEIPYQSTIPNKDSYGRRYGRFV